jgi:hypothetical protein
MPPSSAAASSYEDKANSYNPYGYSAALDHWLADRRGGDGDARHVAMKSIRIRHRKSMSPINSYAESNKYRLCSKLPLGPRRDEESQFFGKKASLDDSSHLSGKVRPGFCPCRKEIPCEMRRMYWSSEAIRQDWRRLSLRERRVFRSPSRMAQNGAIDKACGEGLLPGRLAALGELGIHIQTGEGQIFRRIRFTDGAILAEAEFTDEGAMGVRRTVLHQKMVERADAKRRARDARNHAAHRAWDACPEERQLAGRSLSGDGRR